MLTKILILALLAASPLTASRGTDLFEANQFSDAEGVLREEVAAEPDNAKSWQALGMTLLRLNKIDEAQEALRKSATLNPDSAEAPLGLAEAAAREKNFDDAKVFVEEAAKIDKGSPRPHQDKVGKVTRAQLEEIAKAKMKDLTAADLDAAVRTIAGSARSMGVNVEGV